MPYIAFLNDNLKLVPVHLEVVEDGKKVRKMLTPDYQADHLRFVEWNGPAEKAAEFAAYRKKKDPTFGTYVGLFDLPKERKHRNCFRFKDGKIIVDKELKEYQP